jgi:acyl-CoA thioesterase-2
MYVPLEELLRCLDLESVSTDEWEGRSPNPDVPHLFGGQVVAQALAAANRSLGSASPPPAARPFGLARSMHACFLSRGSSALPIRFVARSLRAGRSVRTGTVTALQGDDVLLHTTVSYHRDEPGPSHQIPMDDVGLPEGEAYEEGIERAMGRVLGYELPKRRLPVEIRGVGGIGLFRDDIAPPQARCWIRSRGPLPDDPLVHQCLFAYASDYAMMMPVMNPHPVSIPALRSTSLDHAVWFHRDFRMDDWVLFELDSPVSRSGRGLGRGLLYTRDGELVASCVQEGLLRST